MNVKYVNKIMTKNKPWFSREINDFSRKIISYWKSIQQHYFKLKFSHLQVQHNIGILKMWGKKISHTVLSPHSKCISN